MAYTSSRVPSSAPSRGPPERTRKPIEVIEEAERQWIYTEDELLRAPSIVDGLSPEEEKMFRYKGYNFITQVGIMLKLPQTTISSAAVFMQRFLMRYSLKAKEGRDGKGEKKLHHYVSITSHSFEAQDHVEDFLFDMGYRFNASNKTTDIESRAQQVAATALFLATKVEEHCRKVKELVIACCRVAQKNANLIVDENTKDYWRWRDTIILNEDVLLELLCFDLTVESPYNVLFGLLQYYGVEKQKKLRDAAWGFINDSHMTQACLLFTSRTIAVAALWFAAFQTDAQFQDDERGRAWWEVQKVPLKQIRRALNYMGDFYTNTPNGVQVKSGGEGRESVYAALKSSPLDADGEADKTRMRSSVTPALMTPVRMERSGSEASANGKRPREDEALVNGNGTAPAPTTTGFTSRIPAAARAPQTEENPAKRQKVDEQAPAPTNGTSSAAKDDDAGSEEGEVEE